MDRVKHGKIRAQVKPNLKQEAEAIARQHSALRSLSQVVEASLAFFLEKFREAGGRLDANNFPILSSPPTQEGGAASTDASPMRKRRPA